MQSHIEELRQIENKYENKMKKIGGEIKHKKDLLETKAFNEINNLRIEKMNMIKDLQASLNEREDSIMSTYKVLEDKIEEDRKEECKTIENEFRNKLHLEYAIEKNVEINNFVKKYSFGEKIKDNQIVCNKCDKCNRYNDGCSNTKIFLFDTSENGHMLYIKEYDETIFKKLEEILHLKEKNKKIEKNDDIEDSYQYIIYGTKDDEFSIDNKEKNIRRLLLKNHYCESVF